MCQDKENNNQVMNKKSYNYGVALLRIVFCYMVINFHFYGLMNGDNRFYFLRELAVPIFIFISFYYGYKVIASNDNSLYKKRAIRLLVPYLFWGVIWVVLLWIVSFFTAIQPPTLRDLVMQLLFGSNERLNAPLWFLWEVIVLTIGFVIIHKIFKKYTKYVLIILMVASYVIQYMNLTAFLYLRFSYEIQGAVGRFFEVLPVACMGYIIAEFDLPEKLKKIKGIWILFIVLAIVCIVFVEKIPTPFITFAYAGIKHLIVSTLLFLGLYTMPFEKCPEYIKKAIKWLSGYTMGIYFLHWMVGRVLNVVWMRFFGVEKTLIETFVIFAVCLVGCIIIDKIPIKYSKMLVK